MITKKLDNCNIAQRVTLLLFLFVRQRRTKISYNPAKKPIALLGIQRFLYVNIDGYSYQRKLKMG